MNKIIPVEACTVSEMIENEQKGIRKFKQARLAFIPIVGDYKENLSNDVYIRDYDDCVIVSTGEDVSAAANADECNVIVRPLDDDGKATYEAFQDLVGLLIAYGYQVRAFPAI